MPDVPAARREFATYLTGLICAYHWRADDPGPHQPHEPCATCRRLVREDLYGLIAKLMLSGYVQGRQDAGEEPPELDRLAAPEQDRLVAVMSARAAALCQDHLTRVVQSDPRTFDGGLAAEGGA